MPENTELHAKSMPETPANQPFCFLNIFKPKGITSFDVIYKLRKRLGIKKIGHSGTLDPLAEGVMQVAVGRATRLIDYLGSDKKYIARIKFGFLSSTGDAEGEITLVNTPNFTYDSLLEAVNSLTGDIVQVPPVYSAIKVGGKKLCDLARKGKLHAGLAPRTQNPQNPDSASLSTQSIQKNVQNNALNPDIDENLPQKNPETLDIKIPERHIKIYNAKILTPRAVFETGSSVSEIDIEIASSKGTYIRSYAVDLAALLGTGAYLTALTRTAAGNFTLDNAVSIDNVTLARDAINPFHALDLPKYFLNENEFARVQNGMPVMLQNKSEITNQTSKTKIPNSPVMLIFNETLVSIGVLEDNKIVCKKVFK